MMDRISAILHRKTAWLLLAVSVVLQLSGCDRNGQAKAELGARAGSQVVARADVSTATVSRVEVPQFIQIPGSLEPDEESEVASKRGGIVKQVFIERGDIIRKADLLVTLDSTDAANALAEGKANAAEIAVRLGLKSADATFNLSEQPDVKAAKVQLDWAESNFARDADLLKKKLVSPEVYDKTRSELDSSRQKYNLASALAAQLYQTYKSALTRLRNLEQRVEDMNVKAPFDGLIAERFAAEGEALREGDKVVSLVRINPLRLILRIPEQQAGLVKLGQKVEFSVGAFPDRQFDGVVKHIGPSLKSDSRALMAEAIVPNEEGTLRPGFFATARLHMGSNAETFHVPSTAVRQEGDNTSLFVVDQGVAREKVITLGDKSGDKVQVTSGLKGTDAIVKDARQVNDGTHIR